TGCCAGSAAPACAPVSACARTRGPTVRRHRVRNRGSRAGGGQVLRAAGAAGRGRAWSAPGGRDGGSIARRGSLRPPPGVVTANMHNGPTPASRPPMPTSDADAPPRRRAALRPSPRALLLIALAVALGVGAF